MTQEKRKQFVGSVAQEVVDRIALGNKVSLLADMAIARMANKKVWAEPDRSGLAKEATRGQLNTYQGQPRKLILKSTLSPGDIVMLTAAVRDLHLTYPGMFLTDVRTSCPHLWESNPYITPLSAHDPDALAVNCQYPLVNRSNQLPYHFIHAYRMFLNNELGLSIQPHAFKGDIHLRPEEKEWVSQVQEITGQQMRFWIIVSGGKRDFTNKLWDPARFQKVVDHFRGEITFVQVGEEQHNHPPLDGVINLLGKTDLRQMVRLMYHADGVVCGTSFPMHLAAAVETKPGRPRNRACVVIAGGREPAQWEAYPHHQFLHTCGALPCCDAGGCWRSRILALGDGDEKDHNLCYYPVATPSGTVLPKCLDMITVADVIHSIELFLEYDKYVPGPEAMLRTEATIA